MENTKQSTQEFLTDKITYEEALHYVSLQLSQTESLQQLSSDLDISQSMLSRIKNNSAPDGKLYPEPVKKLLNHFGVSVKEIRKTIYFVLDNKNNNH